MLQVAGSAPSAPQSPVVLPPEQVALLRSLQPMVKQQQQQQCSQRSTADLHLQVGSTDSPALLMVMLYAALVLTRQLIACV